MATNAGTYTVVITNYCGSVTSSVATLTVTKTAGTVTLGSLNQTYNGSAEVATSVTTPSGLTVNLTYNGSANAPTNAGSYTVIGTINDANYQGSATNTLTISKATVSISSGLSANSKTYDGVTSASLSSNSVVLSGVAAGDAANAQLSTNGYTATFANPAAGTAIAVTVSGLTLTGIASANYTFIQPALTANINPAILTITANSATRPFGAPNPVFTAAYSGFVNGEGSSVLSGTLVLSTTATTNSPVGAYPIVPSQATLNSPNYNFNLINGTLTVTEVPVSLALQFVAGTGFQTNQAVLSCAGLTPGNVSPHPGLRQSYPMVRNRNGTSLVERNHDVRRHQRGGVSDALLPIVQQLTLDRKSAPSKNRIDNDLPEPGRADISVGLAFVNGSSLPSHLPQ